MDTSGTHAAFLPPTLPPSAVVRHCSAPGCTRRYFAAHPGTVDEALAWMRAAGWYASRSRWDARCPDHAEGAGYGR